MGNLSSRIPTGPFSKAPQMVLQLQMMRLLAIVGPV